MLGRDDILRRKKMWEDVETAIHAFFRSRGYEHFRTPLLVKSPGMEPNLDPLQISFTTYRPGKTVSTAGLITSPEYSLKKIMGEGFEKVYSVTPVWRGDEALYPKNTTEFTMLEWYRLGGDYRDCMNDTEELVNGIMGWTGAWPRIKYQDAKVDEHGDPGIAKEIDRFFLIDYPPAQAALSKMSADGTYAERFEAYVGGLELCNGFTELTDPAEQRRRFELEAEERRTLGKHVFPIDEQLLASLGKINGQMYGNALGVDRLVMLKNSITDINDIQIFPATDNL
jgi:lysyl-tRNA synthetase class 2